ncbi:MAG: glycogen/starch synthase, partial [Nitrospinota bacterium]
MSPPPRVAMVASEMYPFAKSGGLGDVLGALPPALARQGVGVSVFLPAYKSLLKNGGFTPVDGDFPDIFGDAEDHYSLLKRSHEGTQVFALRCGDLFDRGGFYGDDSGEYPDNPLRFSRFCRGVLSALERMNGRPDILHCHDWQSALVPALLKTRLAGSPAWSRTASVLTIHNLGYQGRYGSQEFLHTGLPPEAFGIDGVEYYGDLNLLKGGIVCAEVVSTVSESYAQEIQTPEQGQGLEGVIASRAGDLLGIMNGVDYAVWDPARDPHLTVPFNREEMEGKAICRRALRAELGLKGGGRGPLCVMISRLASQKGVELLLATLDDLLWMGLEVAVLGTGEVAYETTLRRAAERYHRQMAFR